MLTLLTPQTVRLFRPRCNSISCHNNALESSLAGNYVLGMTSPEHSNSVFSPDAEWIWDSSNPYQYSYYAEARRHFEIGPEQWKSIQNAGNCRLLITAEAAYMARLNGRVVGHGPAKSAAGRRSVDTWSITGLLRTEVNELHITVLSLGTGTINACAGAAAVIFEMQLPHARIVSDDATEIRTDARRNRRTVRRRLLPCTEDLDATVSEHPWLPATVVAQSAEVYHRRVPLPSRAVVVPTRLLRNDWVTVPNVHMSFRTQPYLATEDKFALIVTEIVSAQEQPVELLPSLGAVDWYLDGCKVCRTTDNRRDKDSGGTLTLRAGKNRLVGLTRKSLLADVSLVGFAASAIEWQNPFGDGCFQMVPISAQKAANFAATMPEIDWTKQPMPNMDPRDSMPWGNVQDVVAYARHVHQMPVDADRLSGFGPGSEGMELAGAGEGDGSRYIFDLGTVCYGWLSFDVEGKAGSVLHLAFLEAVTENVPLQLQWLDGCSNGLTYRLTDGFQQFESFFAYGVRYIAIVHVGPEPAKLQNLQLHRANCGSLSRALLHCSDALLTDIFELNVHTVIAGSDDTLINCPTREQANWAFDGRAAAYAHSLSCTSSAVVANSILLFAEDPETTDVPPAVYPSADLCTIPMHAFHWVMWCWDYYLQTADKDFIAQVMPRIAATIRACCKRLNCDNLLEWPDVWHCIDSGPGRDDDHAINAAEQAGFAGALEAAIQLADAVDAWDNDMQDWQQAQALLAIAVDTLFWDEEKNAYADSIHLDGTRSAVSSQTTNAMICRYGMASSARRDLLYESIKEHSPTLLPCGNPAGLYYVLEFLDMMGDGVSILRIVRKYWGSMVHSGDSTIWQSLPHDSHPPQPCRCHTFNTYISKYLTRYLLGIERVAPGYAEFRIAPDAPGIQWCRGSVSTVAGPIYVHWWQTDTAIQINVEHPASLKRVKSGAEDPVLPVKI